MRFERQGHNECLLATYAMLADMPIDKARCIASSVWSGWDWVSINLAEWFKANPKKRTMSPQYEKFLTLLGFAPEDKAKLVEAIFPLTIKEAVFSLSIFGRLFSEYRIRTGKGIAIIVWADGPARHAVAYEKGKIYDPNAPRPMTLAEWRKWSEENYPKNWLPCIFERVIPINGGMEQ